MTHEEFKAFKAVEIFARQRIQSAKFDTKVLQVMEKAAYSNRKMLDQAIFSVKSFD